MSDTQLRMYCLEQARSILGTASLTDILEHAEDLYEFLVGASQATHH